LDQAAIAPLGLVPTGVAMVHTPSTDAAAPHSCNQYDVSLILPVPRRAGAGAGSAADLEGAFRRQGIDGLLGRDVLGLCTLVYNAPAGGYTLAY
jgi:hypothetical protein